MMDFELISAEQINNLPADPEQCFAAYEAIVRNSMNRLIHDDTNGHFDRAVQLQYVTSMSTAAQECGIYDLPVPPLDDNEFFAEFARFSLAVSGYVNRIRLRNRRGLDASSVLLTANTKTKIGFHIERLRDEVRASNLSEGQKKALNSKLDELSAELERPRVGYAKVMAVLSNVVLVLTGVAALTTVAADGPKAITNVASIMKLIAHDKETEEAAAARLAPPQKALPAPPRKAAPVQKPAARSWETASGDLDDEIPF